MKLIVGLGNPGEKYAKNRHNVGFMFVDYMLETFAKRVVCNVERFTKDKYVQSEIAILHEMILIKPQTYMNKSGEAVAACLTRFAIHDTQNDLIVVHDDLDIPFGKFKIQMQGPKVHNGLISIQNKLRTVAFLRIRIGVDNRPAENRMAGEEYVLQNFSEDEQTLLPELFRKIEERFIPLLQPEK